MTIARQPRKNAARRPPRPPSLSREELTDDVLAYAWKLEADLVGIASVDRFEGAPQGHHPLDWLPSCKSVIVLAVRQLNACHDWPWMMQGSSVVAPEMRLTFLQEYWYTMENHDVIDAALDQMAFNVARHLQRLGHASIFHEASVQPYKTGWYYPNLKEPYFGLFSHRHAAVRAGLGEFGLNNLVITPEYGPYVRFASVLTEADLIPDELLTEKACLGLECSLCLDLCGGEILTLRPEFKEDEVWLNPPTRTDRVGCIERRKTEYCRGQCLARCPVGLPKRMARKRLSHVQRNSVELTVLQQVKWPAHQAKADTAADPAAGNPQPSRNGHNEPV